MVLAGEVENWSAVGGPDMPLVLHGLAPGSDLQKALSARLGRDVVPQVQHRVFRQDKMRQVLQQPQSNLLFLTQ